MLGGWCHQRNIRLDNPAPVLFAGERISSSRLRACITAGQLGDSAEMLGRPYTLYGTVGTGAGRGESLGFATANLHTEDECFPPDGVYAGHAQLADGKNFSAAINLGAQPTFHAKKRQIEAHLIGFKGNLVGQEMDLSFEKFLRPVLKFESPDALAEQIKKDISACIQTTEL